jgi:hypothetical protein
MPVETAVGSSKTVAFAEGSRDNRQTEVVAITKIRKVMSGSGDGFG